MAENFKYWLYDKSTVTPWYFGKPKANSTDDRLKDLGLLEETPVQPTGLLSNIKKANEPWLLEKTWDFFTWVKETVEEPLFEIQEWVINIAKDVESIAKWDIKNAPWLIWDFARSTRKGADRIQKLNAAIDETWGNFWDKAVWFWLNIFWEIVDFWWDVIMAGIKTLAPESLEVATEEKVKEFAQSEFWQDVIGFAKEAGTKWEQFKASSPEANRFGLSVESVLPVAEIYTGWIIGKVTKDVAWELLETWIKKGWDLLESWKDIVKSWSEAIWESVDTLKQKVSDIELPSFKWEVDEIPDEMRTVKGNINWIEVEVPEVIRPVTEIVADKISPTITNKKLAWSAVRPRTIGKSRKQQLESIAKVEERTKNFYNNIRTGVLEWDISTLENSAKSIVSNLDTVWARIGNAVSQTEGNIALDVDLFDKMVDATSSKGSKVSPATPILKNFLEELWDWNLSIAEAYSLKKWYSNEVTKLVKGWDAGTDQYKALADWVNFLNTKIDEIIETNLWTEFADDKKLYRDLLFLADDMVASSLVDGRRTANTLAERIGMLESITSPIASTKWKLISASERVNTRGWAWEELIKRYDEEAIKNAWIK